MAEKYPQLCEAETEFFSELLGTHVQRLATIAHGDGVCTTFIPHSAGHGAPPGTSQAGGTPQTTDPGTEPPRISLQTEHHASESTAGRNPA